MRQIRRLILISVAFMIAGPVLGKTRVYILAGQSNMGGTAGPDFDQPAIPSPYDAPQTDVKILGSFNESYWSDWQNVQIGFGRLPKSFGPEVSFGHTLHNSLYRNDDIYLVKYGVSATLLSASYDQWNVSVNGGAGGALYQGLKSTLDSAIQKLSDAGLAPEIAGMIWMQGESDAEPGPMFAAAYAQNLKNLIERVRSDFKAPTMPFVVGRITPDWGTPVNNGLVRNAQMSVPAQVGHASWINTDDLQQNPTNPGHYGTQGQIDLGIRFANEIAKISSTPD